MKRTLRYYMLVLLSVAAVCCAAFGLAACDVISGGNKLVELSIENAKVNFMVGDEFECGEDFTVYAVYKDETRKDVTDEVKIDTERGFDMNVPGDYQITVRYGGKSEVYTIYVNEFEPILRKIELNTDDVKKSYLLGDKISFEGIKITLTHENAQGQMLESYVTNVKGFKVQITHENGTVVDEILTELGSYTVTVSSGSIKAEYGVSVDGVNLSSVMGAIALSKIYQSEVVSGTQTTQSAIKGGNTFNEYNYVYEYGDNYTYLKETIEHKAEWHCSIEDDEIFCIKVQGGQSVNPGAIQSAMMEGPETLLYYNHVREFGVENVLNTLYKYATDCTNKDLKETANEATREYSFSYSGLLSSDSRSDYYEQEITFKLGEKFNIESADITQKYWENNSTNIEAKPTFTTDANGFTKALTVYSKMTHIVFNQETGTRTAVNPYSKESFKPTSFDVMYKGEVLPDGGTIECEMPASGTTTLNLLVSNIVPDTASFDYYPLYMNYEGNFGDAVDTNGGILSNKLFNIYRMQNMNIITVTLLNGGEWTLILTSGDVTKTVNFKVKGVPPTSMTAQIRNDATGSFRDSSEKTLGIGGTVYFKARVNEYADSEQRAEITSENKTTAKLEQVEINGVSCFKFSATEAGVYTVKVYSTANSLNCTLTFTVQEAPDYASVLTGKYAVTDLEGNYYLLEFSPNNEGEQVKGTVVVTFTPAKEDDGTLQPDKAKTQTLSYSVDFGANEVVLTNVSGTNLGILLSVELNGSLVLNDKYGDNYTLSPVTD